VSLRKYLASQHPPSGIGGLDPVAGSFTAQGKAGGAGLNSDLEVDFQIGDSFTTRGLAGKHKKGAQKQAPGFLMTRPNPAGMTRGFSIREGSRPDYPLSQVGHRDLPRMQMCCVLHVPLVAH
jgi:hypothetical protein